MKDGKLFTHGLDIKRLIKLDINILLYVSMILTILTIFSFDLLRFDLKTLPDIKDGKNT
jgi:hypothetical protein